MQSRRIVHLAAAHSPQASPAPVFGALHEAAIERVRFDVAGDCDEMPVVLHDEGLEASLIDLSRACRGAPSVQPLGVRQRDEPHVLRKIPIALRPQQQMPMVGHQAPREYAHRYPLLDLRQHALEGLVVAIRVEDAAFTVRAIEHMIDKAARRDTQWPWHGSLTRDRVRRSTGKGDPAPFLEKGS